MTATSNPAPRVPSLVVAVVDEEQRGACLTSAAFGEQTLLDDALDARPDLRRYVAPAGVPADPGQLDFPSRR